MTNDFGQEQLFGSFGRTPVQGQLLDLAPAQAQGPLDAWQPPAPTAVLEGQTSICSLCSDPIQADQPADQGRSNHQTCRDELDQEQAAARAFLRANGER